jgi:hypothetical protein
MTTFLTALAPDAKVKGSRDPLGFLPVWARLGRRLIRNVTTVSGDLRGWTTLLLSVGMVRQLLDEERLEIDKADAAFFRAEQLIGYSRIVCEGSSDEVRGVSRARAHLREARGGASELRLGISRERRILGNQRNAGVWGQISSSAEASGLVHRQQLRLLRGAAELWESLWWPALAPHWRTTTSILLDQRGFEPAGRDAALAKALAGLTAPQLHPSEVPVIRAHILYGDQPEDSDQGRLVTIWQQAGTGVGVDIPLLLSLAERAEQSGASTLSQKLRDIAAAEHLLAPAEVLFRWLLTQDRQPLSDAVTKLKRAWPAMPLAAQATDELMHPPARAAYPGVAMPEALTRIREALVSADWEAALSTLIQLNGLIMAARGGAPWVVLRDGVLDVRLGDENANLPDPSWLQSQIIHSFYLDPMRRLIQAWEVGHDH